MPSLDISGLSPELASTGAWAAALLHAIARDEAAGRRTPRLTEPRLDTWMRFRGRLDGADLVALLFEDAAVIHRIPFEGDAVGGPRLDLLPPAIAESWLGAVGKLKLDEPSAAYIAEQARLLGVSTRLARSELHVVKAHQKVLELPGTGGQLAHHLLLNQNDLTLQENFVIACTGWRELTLAGLIGLDRGAPHSEFAVGVEADALRDTEHPLRQRTFDFVIGLHPDKGGVFRVEDQLAIWFPNAKVLLV